MSIVPTADSDRSRFWAKVDKHGPVSERRPDLGSCWLWTAATFINGYGAFRLGSKQRRAHVVSYEWHTGPTDGLLICHHCDVRRCVNPTHLFGGTQRENIQDAVSKSRMATGGRNGMHTRELTTLSEAQVRQIHALATAGANHGDIGAQFGVSQTMVSNIARGDAWGHLGLPPLHRVTLSVADVLEIRRLAADGVPRDDIATRFAISKGAVNHIHHRRTWRNLP